jgi:hypothetical protein
MAFDLSTGGRGVAALATVVEICASRAVARRVGGAVARAARCRSWYVGIDAGGTRIGDALWRELIDGRRRRLVALFRLSLPDTANRFI